ncbi:MAG: hypothetical protein Tsb0013_13840 [Phycisphaerales bacterium]
MTTKYDLGRHADRCAATGEELKPGDHVIVALIEKSDDEGMDRLDYRVDAWERGERPGRVFAYWETQVPEPTAKPRPLVEQGELLGLFESLEDTEDPKRLAFRHLLALELIRRRTLVKVGNEPCAMLVRRKEDGPDGEPVRVLEPDVDTQTLASVTQQFAQIVSAPE